MSLLDFDKPPDRYAVMGNPIGHSKSPFIHRMFARETGQSIEYEAIQVDPGGFDQAVGNFFGNGGKGLNVTVPFKQDAWRLVEERSEGAEIAGAVNTISLSAENRLIGNNTDGIGLVRDLRDNLQQTLEHSRILVLGAGGAVRGIIGPIMAQQPALLVVANRTREKAEQLAGIFAAAGAIEASGFDDVPHHDYDLIINGTAASLQASVPAISAQLIHPGSLCYDLMYSKEPTVFMTWCREHGAAQVADGLGMLVEQAAESFYIWRGVRPQTKSVIDALRR